MSTFEPSCPLCTFEPRFYSSSLSPLCPFLFQSSGNVWVTHEEMENMATSTKTVRLAALLLQRISYRAGLQTCTEALKTPAGKGIFAVSHVSALGQHRAPV